MTGNFKVDFSRCKLAMENYILYDEVGRGEHSVVYKGRKKGTIEFVAIHCVEKCKRLELRNIVRLTHEMDHPNVVGFHEWYETTNHIWMVVELCTGDSLDAVLSQDKRLPVETVRHFGVEIVKALFYIHSQGILYCDLRPSRIMLDGAGILKLSDFALAMVEGEDDFYDVFHEEHNSDADDGDQNYSNKEHAYIKRPKPSPHYMAPEVLSGSPHSKEADLWSFGCILYEMFTGEQPFVADSFPELVSKILNDSSPHVNIKTEGAANGALQELEELIQSLLQKDPLQRLSWENLITHNFWDGLLVSQLDSDENAQTAAVEEQEEYHREESNEEASGNAYEQLQSEDVKESKEDAIKDSRLLNAPEQMIRQGTYTFSSGLHVQSKESEFLGKTQTVARRTISEDQKKSIQSVSSSSRSIQHNKKEANAEAFNSKLKTSTPLKRNQTFNKKDFNGLQRNEHSQSKNVESNTPLVGDSQGVHDRDMLGQKGITDLANHPSDFVVTPIADNPKIKKFSLPKWDSKSLSCQPLKPGDLVDLPQAKFEEHLSAISSLLSQSDKSYTGPMATLQRNKLHTSSYLASLCQDGEIANAIFDSDFISVMLKQIKSGFSADFKARLGR